MAPSVRLLSCIAAAATLAACTPVQWQHASLGVAPTQAEVDECNRAAFYEAQRQAFFYDFARPGFYPGHFGPRWHRPWPRYSMSDRFFLERDLFDYCLRAKGYRLVAVPDA
jgi:hypothetical protein